MVRISGPRVPVVAQAIVGRALTPRHAHFVDFRDADGTLLDHGLALYFPAPHSFTGEAVLELQGHGGPVVMDRLLQAVCQAGARLAAPGEFSERAFLNGKLDLTQAEAIADLIDASSRQAATAALRSLQGAFSQRIAALSAQVNALRTLVEAAIDFADDDIDFIADADVAARLEALLQAVDGVGHAARQGLVLREGMRVAIAGQPNVGKSSLLNTLAGDDTAIVTDIPGTTRDLLHASLHIDGMPLTVTDTAGLRESADPIETEGIRRARAAFAAADRVLVVVDDRTGLSEPERELLAELTPATAVTLIYNKCDLSGRRPSRGHKPYPWVRLSATVGAGVAELREHLKAAMGYRSQDAGLFTARRRHLDALTRARSALEEGRRQMAQCAATELLAEELRLAQRALGEIVGDYTTEDLLGSIFSTFCIGK